ncbi:D-Ala-D-Ala carboxypeptidase family metallohydrolase [Ensifer sp. SSB1]|uniref:D-Ala-D-Ala carboxypeptidase family metallohydrolase n=1 Tax=Ensifer sp. SSB1 TaxID=2795385 RepID=UPI001A38485C|nr:D-Ala-D-Ala carboxypeptidase family metallohydrolase [Ensifer sp. SSB1]MBK5568280.1 DUF882 domain-containing protein [Ensifer sp. SSB1]
MQHLETQGAVLAAIARAAALSVSLLALSSCVSAVADGDVAAELGLERQAATQTAESAEPGAVRDAQVAAMGSDPQAQQTATARAPTQGQPLTMQSTGLSAANSSIYGQAAATQAMPSTQPEAAGTAPAGQPALNATTNSLFSGGQRRPLPIMTPQQGAANETSAAPSDTAVAAYAPTEAQEHVLPASVPLPLSAEAAAGGEKSAALQAVANAEVAPATTEVAVAEPTQAATEAKESDGDKEAPKAWTLATLFAGKRKEKQQEAQRTAQPAEKKTITTSNASQPQTASLAYTLPGVKLNTLYNFEHEEHLSGDDDAPVQVASLSGLARLAPSGLILQTEKVDAGCFKPELMQMLKKVESHYGKQVMVTSGLRPIKVNREKQSLHTRCEAADIQVQGVSKWDLAEFLRSVPGRGGVGTYCHTESVHIDIGTQRDWNWRCRRGKG